MWLTVGDRLSASADWGGFTPSEASVPAIVKTILQPEPAASPGKECKALQVVYKGMAACKTFQKTLQQFRGEEMKS